VRSVRVGTKVRQETVAQLGELDAEGRIAARHLADSIVGLERQPGLFDEDLPTEPVTVVPSRLRLERGRRFGDVWLAWKLWQALGLDTWLEKRLPKGREDVPWSLMAAVLVIARLCEPSSELHIAEIGSAHAGRLAWLPRPRSTTTDSIARWTGSCRTRTLERTSRNASELCSGWNMIFY
jgi:hypothetical protein